MGFNKRYLPEIKELKKQHKELGTESLIARYTKCDALMGPPESHKYLNNLINPKKTK